jgi:PAS domain S-box-containing protein
MKLLTKNILVCLIVAAMYLSGLLDFAERRLIDLRFQLLQRDASGEIVVVKIDPASLAEQGVWPWPRSRHAELLDRLFAAGAQEVALDIDFSSQQNPIDDARLAEALRKYGNRVILPVFKQEDRHAPTKAVSYTEPIPQFKASVRTASLNMRSDSDGVVRVMDGAHRWPDRFVQTLATMLADISERSPSDSYNIDFGIRAQSIVQISYADVLRSSFDTAQLAAKVSGRKVIVGATALELGDNHAVPVRQDMAGPLIQAIAAESLLQHRDLAASPVWVVLFGVVLIVAIGGTRFRNWTWKFGLLVTLAAIIAILSVALMVQAYLPVILYVTPLIVAVCLTYVVGLTGRIEDQSVRLLAQGLALKHQDAFMRRVVNNTFDGLLTIDAIGSIRSFNPAAQRIFGMGPDELLGQNFAALLTGTAGFGEGSGAATSLLGAVARSGTSRGIMGRRRDGSAFPMDLAVTEMQESGTSVYISLVRDISARAAAETMAAEAQQRLVDALESINEAFVLCDAQDRIVLFNEKFRELHGPAGNLIAIGSRFDDIVRGIAGQGLVPEATGRIQEWIRERMARHRDPQGSFEMEMTSGQWYRISERRTMGGGVVGTMIEITEEKRREQELRRARDAAEIANRSKSEFLANMSHELRTPLNAIIGFSELMKNEVLGPIGVPSYGGYVRDIHESAQHLLGIINDILDLSRVEAGKLKLFESTINIVAVVQGVVRLISERATDAAVKIAVDSAPDMPALWADERLVKQMLINLLANAVKFTPRGGQVTVKLLQDPTGAIALMVTDTGIGISETDMAKVMEPFGQADGSLRRRYDGTGLGLPLVRSFVELHGATFDLDSRVGAGTTAIVRFPLERTLKAAPPLAAASNTANNDPPSNVTNLRSA